MNICSAVHGFYSMCTDTAGANNHIFAASCSTCTKNKNKKAFEKELQFNSNLSSLMFNKRNKNIFIHYLWSISPHENT